MYLRSYKNNLVMNHDSFEKIFLLEDFLKSFNQNYLILNFKNSIFDMYFNIEKFGIHNYFFLYKYFPISIKKLFRRDKKTVIRYLSYKLHENVINFKNIVKLIWVDFYKYYTLNKEIIDFFKKYNFKICLFSPELKVKSIRMVRKLKFSFIKLKNNLILLIENIFQDRNYFLKHIKT